MEFLRQWIGVILVLAGLARAALVVVQDPMVGYANQFDMHRTSACIGLFPADEAAAKAATPEAPISRYALGSRTDGCYLASEVAIGTVTVLGVAVLSQLAVVFIGGPEYAALQGRLWVFAALGTLLAMLQLMIYDVVARQHQRMVFVVWAGMALLLAAAPFLDSLTALLSTVVTIDALLFVVLLLASLRTSAPAEPAPVAEAPVP